MLLRNIWHLNVNKDCVVGYLQYGNNSTEAEGLAEEVGKNKEKYP